MSLKKKTKTSTIQIRISEFDKNRLKILANKYANGVMTDWIMHAIHEAPRTFLKPTVQQAAPANIVKRK